MEWNKEQKDKFKSKIEDKYGGAFFGMVHNHVIELEKVGLLKQSYQEEYIFRLTNCLDTEIALDKLLVDINTEKAKAKKEVEITIPPKRSF